MIQSVKLVDTDSADLRRTVDAKLSADGGLAIDGQDLGAAVERVWGEDMIEYEWSFSISPEDVTKLKLALGCTGDVLAVLKERFSGEMVSDLGPFLKTHGIPYGFWSRFGD